MDHAKQIDDLAEALASTESELRDAREALARVEAERDAVRSAMRRQSERHDELLSTLELVTNQRDTAQAQLAEAVGLLNWLKTELDDFPSLIRVIDKVLARHAQAEQQEATKRGKPDWNSHSYDQIFQTSDGNWFGARAGWDFKGHISDGWKGREVSLLRDDGGFLAYGEPNPDWENSLEQRPVQEAQGAQAGEFEREDRYIVIKRKDLEAAPFAERHWFKGALSRLEPYLPRREHLVIESDWPEYEPTWVAIQARMNGQGAQAVDERVAFEALWERLNIRGYARKDEAREFWNQGHRAALATQPAAGEPVASSDELAAFEKWRHTQADSLRRCGYPDGADAFIRLGSVQWAGWQARARLTSPPAAAHGDEAVRKDAERYQFLKSEVNPALMERLDCNYPSNTWDVHIDAAMRAQSDGEPS